MLPLGDLLSDAPSRKDVVVGALGASSALAGLILVFLGVVIGQYEGLEPGVPASASTNQKRAVAGIMAAFLIGLLGSGLALLWLITSGCGLLYAAVVGLLFAQLVTTAGVALYTTYKVLF